MDGHAAIDGTSTIRCLLAGASHPVHFFATAATTMLIFRFTIAVEHLPRRYYDDLQNFTYGLAQFWYSEDCRDIDTIEDG